MSSSLAEEVWPKVVLLSLVIKLLLLPAYFSTDFEVHRNWLAITSSLPLNQWYIDATSIWTLDYPPFFAYFELLLSVPASWYHPAMLQLENLDYQAYECILYQRITVLLSELVLAWSLYRFIRLFRGKSEKIWLASAILFNAGLVLVDHIHFQYNGFLLGVWLNSIVEILQGQPLRAAAWFCLLLHLKHIYLYVALAYFVYLLRGVVDSSQPWTKLVKLGSVVVVSFICSLGPFYWNGTLLNLLKRLFPFQRGLFHTYWAPNVWALYAFLDRVLNLIFGGARGSGVTRGILGDTAFSQLSEIPPSLTFVLTLLTQLPALAKCWMNPTREIFLKTLICCAFSSFLFGWHVHEKAILLIIFPYSLICTLSPRLFRGFVWLTIAGHAALFPLLFGAAEIPLRLLIQLCWVLVFLPVLSSFSSRQKGGEFGWLDWAYLGSFGVLEFYAVLGHYWLFGPRWEFLPLMLRSVWCAFGVFRAWIDLYISLFQEDTLLILD